MKEHIIPTYNLGKHTLDNAFDIVFSADTLVSTHGDSLNVSDWIDDKRTSNFDVKVDRIPWPLTRIFRGNKMRVSVTQTRTINNDSITVNNNIKLHFMGSRFFKIESWFALKRKIDTGRSVEDWSNWNDAFQENFENINAASGDLYNDSSTHSNYIELSGSVKCQAFLLPPLNMIAESFMISQCKRETETYTEIIKKKFD